MNRIIGFVGAAAVAGVLLTGCGADEPVVVSVPTVTVTESAEPAPTVTETEVEVAEVDRLSRFEKDLQTVWNSTTAKTQATICKVRPEVAAEYFWDGLTAAARVGGSQAEIVLFFEENC